MWLSRRARYSRLSKWGKLGEQSIVENYNCLPNQLPFSRIVKPITLAIGSLASANTPKRCFFHFKSAVWKLPSSSWDFCLFYDYLQHFHLQNYPLKLERGLKTGGKWGVLLTDNARHWAQQRQTAKPSFGMALCAKYTVYRCANPLMKKLVLPFLCVSTIIQLGRSN